MKRFLLLSGLALVGTQANADDQAIKQPLDPVAVVRQLYILSDRSWAGAASYQIWGDGSVHFHIEVTHEQNIYGDGATPEDALDDLKSKSTLVAATIVPKAEATKASILSVVEGIKALLFGSKASQ
jgi:hypothetical protein